MCEDRSETGTVIVCPKLTTLAEYLSSTAGPAEAGQDHRQRAVPHAERARGEGRTGSWSKGSVARVRAVPLDAAVERFEQLRHSGVYEHAVVVGSDRCTVVQPV